MSVDVVNPKFTFYGRKIPGCHIELKLGLLMTKGQLEVDVVCARGIRAEDSPPGL